MSALPSVGVSESEIILLSPIDGKLLISFWWHRGSFPNFKMGKLWTISLSFSDIDKVQMVCRSLLWPQNLQKWCTFMLPPIFKFKYDTPKKGSAYNDLRLGPYFSGVHRYIVPRLNGTNNISAGDSDIF